MKKIYPYILLLSTVLFSACDYIGSYTFKIKNNTTKSIVIKFSNKSQSSVQNPQEVAIFPDEERTIRTIDGTLNTEAHDCLRIHGMDYFEELYFDLFADDVKIEKQFWQRDYWQYEEQERWSAQYRLVLTDGMLE
jgi:hypothetical protein